MEENKYKYLVNPFNIVEIVDSGIHKSHGPNDPDTVTLYFSRDKLKELKTFSKMFLYDDVLFTIPGNEKVYYMLDYSPLRASVYSITLEVTDVDFSSAKSLREICSREEYDNLHKRKQ